MGEPISNTFASFNDEDSKEKKDIISSEINKDENSEKEVAEDIESTVTAKKEEEKLIEIEDNLQKGTLSNPEITIIKELISDLSIQFESKIKYDKHKDEIIDKLHSENQALKNDLYKKLILPLVNELIYLIDDYSTLFKKHSESDISDIDSPKLLKQFGSISEDLEDVLYKSGINVYSVEGDRFDASKQKVIKTISTDDSQKDKTVFERLKKGFELEGKIIRMEHVSCYKFKKTNV